MFLKIIFFIIILIISIILIQIYNNNHKNINTENFINNNLHINNRSKTIGNNLKNTSVSNDKINNQQTIQIDEKILFNNRDYNQNLSIDNKDNKYYYDNMIDQSNINENAFNIVYSIDPIDYSNVKTGIDKCNEECKGICFENGYDGVATCYPNQQQSFDWGTLYKNPTFTYGYNAYGPNNLPQ